MHKIQVGDVFLIPLGNDQYGVGQVLARYQQTELYYMCAYDELIHGPHQNVSIADCSLDSLLFLVFTFDAIIADGGWPVIGNTKPPSDVPFPTYKVIQAGEELVESWDGSVRRRARPGETMNLDNRGGVSPIRLEKALKAHHGLQPWHPAYDKMKLEYIQERQLL